MHIAAQANTIFIPKDGVKEVDDSASQVTTETAGGNCCKKEIRYLDSMRLPPDNALWEASLILSAILIQAAGVYDETLWGISLLLSTSVLKYMCWLLNFCSI